MGYVLSVTGFGGHRVWCLQGFFFPPPLVFLLSRCLTTFLTERGHLRDFVPLPSSIIMLQDRCSHKFITELTALFSILTVIRSEVYLLSSRL
jgi:hypothetical protein